MSDSYMKPFIFPLFIFSYFMAINGHLRGNKTKLVQKGRFIKKIEIWSHFKFNTWVATCCTVYCHVCLICIFTLKIGRCLTREDS